MRTRSDRGGMRRGLAGRHAGAVGGAWRHATAIGLAGWLASLALGAPASPAQADALEPPGAEPASHAGALDTSRAPVAGDWVVLQAAGDATWRPQGSVPWQPVARGQVLPAQSEVEAGPTGDVLAVVGGDRLVVAPHSRLILPARSLGQDQRLRLDRGRIRVDVERRPERDVEVRTPLLSLGIKGTSIEVTVDREQNSVLVIEGQVSVTTPGAAAPANLGPGQGLQQLATPDAAATRLEYPGLPPRGDRAAAVRWHLPPPADTAAAASSDGHRPIRSANAAPAAVEHDPVNPWGRPRTPRESRGDSGVIGAWLDDQTSLFTILLIAVGGAAILIIPGMLLGQHLRQHWRDRPPDRGKRRHNLTRG